VTIALDASALLAMLRNEPGGDAVSAILDGASICSVNYSEVIANLVHTGATPALADQAVDPLPIIVVPADTELAKIAGHMRGATARAGLSLGDRFCLAFAKRDGLKAWTADRRWADVADAVGVAIKLIR
jgi:ribonuclease VapC